MEFGDFYDDRKFCTQCNDYVPYLMSMDHSYCTGCGSPVKLFSKEDWGIFTEKISPAKKKSGRPAKKRNTA